MMILELSVFVVALTFMLVNLISLLISIKLFNKYEGLLDKSLKCMNKIMDKTLEQMESDEK